MIDGRVSRWKGTLVTSAFVRWIGGSSIDLLGLLPPS